MMKYNFKAGRYKHFKGNFYELLYIARHSETEEEMVVYRALYEPKLSESIWVRPAAMWAEEVIYNGETVPRFKLCEEGEK